MCNKCLRLSSLNCRLHRGPMWDKTMDNAVLYFAPPPGDQDKTRIMITALSGAQRWHRWHCWHTPSHSTSITTTAQTTSGWGETTRTGGFKLQTTDQGSSIPSLSSYVGGGREWCIKQPRMLVYLYIRYQTHNVLSCLSQVCWVQEGYREISGGLWSFPPGRIRSIILAI